VPTHVIMPALGMDQDTGTLVRWIKHEGERVERGEPIMEVETDKVVVEIEATASGVLANVTAAEGDEVPVGQVIAQILESDSSEPRVPGSELGVVQGSIPRAQIARPHRGDRERESVATPGTGPGTRNPELGTVRASPKARRVAAEQGVDLSAVAGSGPEGAILAADLTGGTPPRLSLSAARERGSESAERTVVTPQSSSRAWRVMAERMAAAWSTIPHFALVREVDASALRDMHSRLAPAVSKRTSIAPTYTDLLVKLIATAIRRQPRINASWRDGTIQQHPDVNVGFAVATDDGLIVPVVQHADTLSVGEVAARRQELVERATAGKLTPADVSGGTFTLSNLGMYGVDAFSGIVNPPEAAILAVGRMADRVVAVDGQPMVRPTLILTLSCDHRAIDGARAAQFLEELAALIEEPWGLLA